MALTASGAAVVGWCGMRGTVTLAAALALPAPFPHRDLILVTAFGVVLGTLVLQGLTLRPLLLRLRLEDDGTVDSELRLARVEALRAAVATLAATPGAESTELIRRRYELQLRRAETEHARSATEAAPDDGAVDAPAADAAVVRAAFEDQRHRLVALRAEGTIGDAAFQRLEEELDLSELGWTQLLPAMRETGG